MLLMLVHGSQFFVEAIASLSSADDPLLETMENLIGVSQKRPTTEASRNIPGIL
jgi:hypothetical protein